MSVWDYVQQKPDNFTHILLCVRLLVMPASVSLSIEPSFTYLMLFFGIINLQIQSLGKLHAIYHDWDHTRHGMDLHKIVMNAPSILCKNSFALDFHKQNIIHYIFYPISYFTIFSSRYAAFVSI